MAEYRVVITDFIHDELEPERAILNKVATLEALDSQHEDQLEGRIEDADAIMLYHSIQLSARTIDRLTQCRLIVRCGVGFDNVDCNMARRKGIPVANIPDYGTEEVADSAVGMILSLTRGIVRLNSQHRDGGSDTWSYTTAKPLYRLREKVCAVVGLGRIGTAVASAQSPWVWMSFSLIPFGRMGLKRLWAFGALRLWTNYYLRPLC
jgi:C-terminal binding protein